MAVLAIRAAALEAGEIEASLGRQALQAAPSAGLDEHPADSAALQVQQAADSDPARPQRGKTVRSAPEAADSVAPHEEAQGVPSGEFVPLGAAAHSAEATQAEAGEVPAAARSAVEEGTFDKGRSGVSYASSPGTEST